MIRGSKQHTLRSLIYNVFLITLTCLFWQSLTYNKINVGGGQTAAKYWKTTGQKQIPPSLSMLLTQPIKVLLSCCTSHTFLLYRWQTFNGREQSLHLTLVTLDKAIEVLKELDVLLMLNSSAKLYEFISKSVVDPPVSQEVHEVVIQSLPIQQRVHLLTATLTIMKCHFNQHLLRSFRKISPSQESLCWECNWSPSNPYLPQAGNWPRGWQKCRSLPLLHHDSPGKNKIKKKQAINTTCLVRQRKWAACFNLCIPRLQGNDSQKPGNVLRTVL